MDDNERKYLMSKRQALIIEIGALEDLLGLPRSIVPKRKREQIAYSSDKDKLVLEQYRTPRG